MRAVPICSLVVLVALGAPLRAQQLELLPDASGRASLSRYAPADEGLLWDAWIGAGLTLARYERTELVFDGDIETVVGNAYRAFDADQVNYHLAGSVRHSAGPYTVSALFHHVSRHRSDRAKLFSFDWNLLGVQVERSLAEPVPARVSLMFGRMLQASRPQYDWELQAHASADVWRRPWGDLYLAAGLGLLGARSSPDYPREGFADRQLEAGLRLSRGPRRAELYARWEHRNDVLLERPGALSRGLFGLRLESGRRGWVR